MNEFLIKFRKRKKYTQQQVADLIGVERSTYTRYELGQTPSLGVAFKLSEITGMTINRLFKKNCQATGTDGSSCT